MREFWVSSGHHLTRRTEGGGLAVTDELLLAYLARPELMPPDEACDAERELHAALLREPRRAVSRGEIEALADADARENWQVIIAFRDRLLAAPSIEAAYLGLARGGMSGTPPLLLHQLVHLIMRNALDDCEDPHTLRAAELFFRPQRASLRDGSVLLADAEIIDLQEQGRGQSPLVAMLGVEPITELDVLTEENAWTYWSRSDAFTMVLNIGADQRARQGLARAIAAWIRHLANLDVIVEPIARMEDADWRWFIGLDVEATRIGNALWNGDPVDDDEQARVIAMFRLTVNEPDRIAAKVAGHPIYLLLAMGSDKTVRVKPQNLIAGLPLRAEALAALI
jgi:hypothetical protein